MFCPDRGSLRELLTLTKGRMCRVCRVARLQMLTSSNDGKMKKDLSINVNVCFA